LAILDAASDKLRPFGYLGDGIGGFRQQAPEAGMVPAETMPGAVSMLADPVPKALHILDELVA
jgi:hypothetical protein